jgi:hypothetical protein
MTWSAVDMPMDGKGRAETRLLHVIDDFHEPEDRT